MNNRKVLQKKGKTRMLFLDRRINGERRLNKKDLNKKNKDLRKVGDRRSGNERRSNTNHQREVERRKVVNSIIEML